MTVGGTHAGKGKKKSPPNYLSEPLTPRTLRKETRAATNIAYRPTERAINAERRASVQRTKDVGNWWNEYLQTVQSNQAATQAAYDKAGAQQQASVAQASSVDNANTAKLNEQESAASALRGQTPPPAPTQRANAAQAQRNYLSAAEGGATAAQGANQFAYLGEQNRIGKGQSIASRKAEQARTRGIEHDKTELAKSRGDYATKFRGEKIDKNHDYLIQRQAFGLDKKKFHAETAANAAAAAQEAAKLGRETHQQEIENRQNQEKINNETKPGGKTQAERNDAKQGRQNAAAAAQTLFEKKQWSSWGALTQAVAEELEVSPAAARAAVKRLREKVEREQKISGAVPKSPFG